MFIKITNESADFIHRTHLEKLGISNKRDNPDTIGQFGSGTKFAPIAALRNGWEWIVCAEDKNGKYRLTYDWVEDEDGIKHVVFDYGDVVKESSYTLDAGLLSWDHPFQIFREAFTNALDAATEFGAKYSVDVVDEVGEPVTGECSVYITASEELLEIANNLGEYFTSEREDEPVYSLGYTRVYDRIGSAGRFYSKGVLINWDRDDVDTLFDYESDNFLLNEERRPKDLHYDFMKIMGSLITHPFEDFVVKMIEAGTTKETIDYEEFTVPTWQIYNASRMWREKFQSIFGEKAAIVASDQQSPILLGKLYDRGWTPVVVWSLMLFTILEVAEVPTAEGVLGESINYNIVDPTPMEAFQLEKSLALFRKFEPGIDNMEVSVFVPESTRVAGVALKLENKILISRDMFKSDRDVLATLLHEYDHFKTGLDDIPEFRAVADNTIANLMMMLDDLIFMKGEA